MNAITIGVTGHLVLSLAAIPLLALAQDSTKDLVKPPDQMANIQAVAFSPDGRYLAACAGGEFDKGEVVLWDAKTLKVTAVYKAPNGVPSIAFSSDSKTLAAGSFSEHCSLLDTTTGKLIATLGGHGKLARGVAFSPDGRTLAVGSGDGSIRLWDYHTHQVLKTLTGHARWIYVVAYSPDGKILASASSDYTVGIWDPANGKQLRLLNDYGNSGVRCVARDPNGKWLVTPSGNGTVKLRDLKDYNKLWANFYQPLAANWVAIAPTGRTLAVGRSGAKSVQIYPVDFRAPTTEEQKRILELIAKWEDDRYEVRENASQELQQFGLIVDPLLAQVAKQGSSPESRLRAQELRKAIRSPKTPVLLEGHWQPVVGAAFSPDSLAIATGAKDGLVIVWDAATYKMKAELRWPEKGP